MHYPDGKTTSEGRHTLCSWDWNIPATVYWFCGSCLYAVSAVCYRCQMKQHYVTGLVGVAVHTTQ